MIGRFRNRNWLRGFPARGAPDISYRRDIDGLRALAVMPVLLYHFGVHELSGGFSGVDVFFVISGYLIAGSLLSDLQKEQFSLINFYWRRFRRLLPALSVVTIASSIAAYLLMPSRQFVDFGWSLMASMSFVSNIYFWKSIDYFSVSAELTPLLHTWSLAVEEQYYIFAPIVMYLTYRFLRGRWIVVLLPVILISFSLSIYGVQSGPRFTFYWLPTRAWEILIGAVLVLCPLPKLSARWMTELVGLVGLVCLGGAYIILTETSVFPGVGALLPCLGAVFLIYAGEHRTPDLYPTISRLLELKPLVGIGLISYSLYLVHWPLVSFSTHALLRPIDEPLLLTGISIVLAAMMWKWVEQPFRTWPKLMNRKATFTFAAVTITANMIMAATVISSQGVPGRSADYVRQKVDTVFWRNRTCFFLSGQPATNFSIDGCTYDLGYQDAKILLWGDSYAAQYVGGLEANATSLGSNVVQITHAGCPPLLSYNSSGIPACAAFNQKAFHLATSGGFSIVLLTALWDIHDTHKLEGLQQTLDKLRQAGLSVIVIGQSPRFLDDVQRISAHARQHGRDPWWHSVEVSPSIRELLRSQTQDAEQTFLDPISLLCNGTECPLADEVDFMAFDEGHMSRRGASVALLAYLDALLKDGQTLLDWGRVSE